MRALTSLSLAALLLAACGSQPPAPEQDPAGVESRKPGAVKVDTPPVTQVRPEQFDANSIAALKDPRSPLSKRSIYFDYDSYVVKDEFQGLLGAHGKFLAGQPENENADPGQCRRARQPRVQPGPGPEARRGGAQGPDPARRREDQLEAVSLGEEKPACTEATEDCWGKNRRGDMLYSGEF
jgi:peptidoglycan-associated lipoprotein